MKKSVGQRLIKVVLSISVSMSSLYGTQGSAAPAAPILNTGGSGGKPPIDPPVTYDDSAGGGFQSKKSPAPKGGPPAANSKIPAYGTEFGIDPQSKRSIYYEGTVDDQGRLRIFKYLGYDTRFVLRGYQNNDPTSAKYQGAVWDSQAITAENFRRIGSGALEPSRQVILSRTYQSFKGDLKTVKMMDVLGKDANGQTIYFEGGVDKNGRVRVFKYMNSSSREYITRGVITELAYSDRPPQINWTGGDKLASLKPQAAKPTSAHVSGTLAQDAKPETEGTAAKNRFYYMGELDEMGREKVWSYYSDSSSRKGFERPSGYFEGVVQDGAVVNERPMKGLFIPSGPDTHPKTATLDAATEEFRPSNLKNVTDAKELGTFKRLFMRLSKGPTFAPLAAPGEAQAAESNSPDSMAKRATSMAGQAAYAVSAFYAAMGMVAAYELITDYPNNPMVFEKYFEKFTPMHAFMMLGFMAVAYPFMKRVPGFTSAGNVVRSVPMFAAGLFAGAVGSVLISMIADPDVQQCSGVSAFALTRSFDLNPAACERAYHNFFSRQMAVQIIPKIASLMVTGGVFLGAYFAINITGIAAAIRAIPFVKGANPTIVGMAALFASAVVWLFADKIAQGLFNVENVVRENMIADADVEDKLFKGWAKLKNDGWVDQFTPLPALPACMRIFRVGLFPKPCDATIHPVAFATVLDNYASMMSTWRGVQLTATYEAYGQWNAKVSDYHAQLGAAFDIYKNMVARIDYENKYPGLSDTDARGFNSTTIRNLERERIDGGIYKGDPSASGWEQTLGLDHDKVVVGDPLYAQDFTGTWKYIYTRGFYDYSIASMACGPETERRSENSFLQNVGSFVSTWVTGNTSPQQIVNEPTGQALLFHPPRIVKSIDEAGNTVCEYPVTRDVVIDTILTPMLWRPEQFSVIAPWFSGKKSYKNLYTYIKDNVRENILDGKNNNFESWWTSSVGSAVTLNEAQLRVEYEKMLRSNYLPTLQNPNYKWCEERETKSISFYPYWLQIAPSQPGGCGTTRIHRLAHGLIDSLRDELHLYLAMAVDAYSSGSHTPDSIDQTATVNRAVVLAHDLAIAYDKYASAALIVDGKLRPDSDALGQAALERFIAFRDYVLPANPDQALTPTEQWTANMLLVRVRPIFEQTKSFYNVLKALEPEPVHNKDQAAE